MKRKFTVSVLITLLLILASVGITNAQNDIAITLSNDTTIVDSGNVTVADNVITITEAGSYSLSGSLSDGQVVVDVDSGTVNLSLEGIEISNSSDPALLIESADEVVISLAEGTDNTLTSTAAYDEAEEAYNAALYSDAELTIGGTGTLTINAESIDGIAIKGALTINDSPVINVNAGDDAIQVKTVFTLTNGELNLVAAGGLETALSSKGIKAGESIVIEDGIVNINAADDAINSDSDFVMNAGTLTLSATGKGITADYNMEINGGTINILNSTEGLEAGFITINDGYINLVASDDGINISEPDDIPNPSLYFLYINGGTLIIDADGDGLDSNGSIEMTGGLVIVNGPTGSGNGAIDYDGTFEITGGTLIAAGSAGMAEAPGTTSSQYSLLVNFDAALEAGTLVHIQNSAGDDIVTFAPVKAFQSFVFSSSDLVEGETYTIYTSGSSDGTATNGLYADGTYTVGDQVEAFTITSVVTQIGESMGMFGGRGGGERPAGDFGGTPPEGFDGTPPDAIETATAETGD